MLLSATQWPALNAALNATSAVCVLAGVYFIRGKRVTPHRFCMVLACLVTAAFFVSYLLYHAQVGSIRFKGAGSIRRVYFTILISHTVLAVTIVPLVLRTLWLILTDKVERHKRLARITVPLWLYVSVTGIVVYWMLYKIQWLSG